MEIEIQKYVGALVKQLRYATAIKKCKVAI